METHKISGLSRYASCWVILVIGSYCLAVDAPGAEGPPVRPRAPGRFHGEFVGITPGTRLNVHLSWGHTSRNKVPFEVQFATSQMGVTDLQADGFEPEDSLLGGTCQSQAGAGDVDGLRFTLLFPEREIKPIPNVHSIWRYLLDNSDPDTARRLRQDPAYRPDSRKLTIKLNAEGTQGFSVTVDQLLANKVFWVPELDVFLSAGEKPVSFAEHQQELQAWHGKRIIDQIQQAPEASYEQFSGLWEDMGSPAYNNPAAIDPGHIVGVTWDGGLYKFGIDRGAGVRNDLGSPDHFRFSFDFGALKPSLASCRKYQKLADGLPVITTAFEKPGVRFEVEQFAYPWQGPPAERHGDIPMVLLQKVVVTELTGKAQIVPIEMTHVRSSVPAEGKVVVDASSNTLVWKHTAGEEILAALAGPKVTLVTNIVQGTKLITNIFQVSVPLAANGTEEFVVKLPSPFVPATERETFLKLDYAQARESTIKFWSDWLGRGAQFTVPDEAVNTLFRANLWHALRLPRRHGGMGTNIDIDLPYSNFAYGQAGTPWPVNQAVYVDYMLYDLRGYHEVSREELAVMFRNKQEKNGHIGGIAEWGVYTPGLLYAVAQHYLLSGDRSSFEQLLPQSLMSLDWCLAQMRQASVQRGAAHGLIRAPLNDLSHNQEAWAFNQAYFYAGVDLLGRALEEIKHPRAAECTGAATSMKAAIERAFANASVLAPLVQLRDQTWTPYVPGDALTPQRLIDIWYPTDVDCGALHLSRLKAIAPDGPLTTALLLDHEDNLFLKGLGMANEPVYNQQATAYLLRDNPKAAIRAFYSMMACAFSHFAFEPVEHRWGWGQYFGPPSTDGAWFELYRNMLIHEMDDESLLLCQATPRQWLAPQKSIKVERAPTYYGLLSFTVSSQADRGEIAAIIDMPGRKQPKTLLVRLRHPTERLVQSVTVNGGEWKNFDPQKEWIRIPDPKPGRYEIIAKY